jgi:hypothetical protein
VVQRHAIDGKRRDAMRMGAGAGRAVIADDEDDSWNATVP